jgi:predicted MFS family arabinose efflux permease
MVILAIVYMFNFVDRQILGILLPAIREEFQVSDAMLGFLSGTAFALFYTTLGIPVALIADRWNRRNLIAAAVAIWSAMTVASGMVANFWQLTLARIGVGIGEAGCSPPAHSMIADMYPPEKRSTAMGFYTTGISAGIMLAYLAGGWVVQNIGWREAFLIVGAPGLLLAAIVRFTVAEPVRGASENRKDSEHRPGVFEVVRFLKARKSFLHMAVAAGLISLTGYAVIIFFPSFVVRSFEMGVAALGVWLGLILGIAGGAGFFVGGYLADHIGKSGQRKSLQFIAVAMLASSLMLVVTFLSPTPMIALLVFIVPAATSNFYLAPVLANTQSLVGLRMRALASALVLFVINLIGLGVGPWLVGQVSDLLQSSLGEESLRYSLVVVCVTALPWAAMHLLFAARHIEHDLARATESD